MLTQDELKSSIRDVPNFPKEGVVFKDITTLLKSAKHFRSTVEQLTKRFSDVDFDIVVGPEARGFFFGAPAE